MHVSLTPELENLVRLKVESGLYNNASEVVREALRKMNNEDEMRRIKIEKLREALAVGMDDIKNRRVVEAIGVEAFLAKVKNEKNSG